MSGHGVFALWVGLQKDARPGKYIVDVDLAPFILTGNFVGSTRLDVSQNKEAF